MQCAAPKLWRGIYVGLVAMVSGAALGINSCTGIEVPFRAVVGRAALAAIAVLAGVVVQAWGTRRLAPVLGVRVDRQDRYFTLDALATTVLLLSLAGVWGVQFFEPQLICLSILFVSAKIAALLAALGGGQRKEFFQSQGWLALLFFISGFAALIYQIVWERALFAAFGVNIESITIVVSLFMLGLGLGSIGGGLVARRLPHQSPRLFLACEIAIGVFGLVSLPLIQRLSGLVLHQSLPVVSLAIFALLCVPTMLMGATLPILVSHLYRHYRNLGQSVGILYCINTAGSAIACFLTADLLFVLLGEHGSVYVAVACNFLVGILVNRYANAIAAGRPIADENEQPDVETSRSRRPGSRRLFVYFFAAAAGYISLSQEMIWMRAVGYITAGSATVFPRVLGFFLVGVAGGAIVGEKLCQRRFACRDGAEAEAVGAGDAPVRFVGKMLLISAIFYYLCLPMAARAMTWPRFPAMALVYAIVVVVSFLLGGIFTVLCHYAARSNEAVGITVSRVYLANIVGSTLGPLLTGFVLMQFVPLDKMILYLSMATALLGGVAYCMATPKALRPAFVGAACAGIMVLIHAPVYHDILGRFHFKANYQPDPYRFVLENRSGIIAVSPARDGGEDILYGGGFYDGRFSIDPVRNSNLVRRCYMIAALHPAPAEVLEIGLATASWTRVLADYHLIHHITTVEISAAYVDMLRRYPDLYPQQASVLSDPKVTIDIDDGRRWLNRHSDARFDLIVQNTTTHWRSEVTNLISADYFQLCKARLKPGGVIYLNTTQSDDITYTVARVFKHVVRYVNFVAASDAPFALTPEQIRANMMLFENRGRPTFSSDDPQRQAELTTTLQAMANSDLHDIAPEMLARGDLWMITDDNMATEFKRRQSDWDSGIDRTRWYDPARSWWAFFNRRRI